MRMELDKFPGFDHLEDFIAKRPEVGRVLDKEIAKAAPKARAILASRPGGAGSSFGGGYFEKRNNPSWIETDRGILDRYLILVDTTGDWGAWSIEMGRKGGFTAEFDSDGNRIPGTTIKVGAMAPVAPLRKAFGVF